MSYLDRLRICTYTSPSGVQFTPHFDEVSRSGSKKAPITELPQLDLPDVQDLGQGAERFAMRLYFDGSDYDITADNFHDAIIEKGLATLSHPRWGDLTVIPVTYAQAEDFVGGARVSIFTVEFVRADSTVSYPVSARGKQATISAVASDMEVTASERFGQLFKIADSRDRAAVIDRIRDSVDIITEGLAPIASLDTAVSEALDDSRRSFLSRLDEALSDGSLIMAQMIRLTRIPARVATSVRDKVRGYLTVYENMSRFVVNPFEGLSLNIEWPSEALTVSAILTAVGIGVSESVTRGTDADGDSDTAEQTVQNTVDLAVIRDGIQSDISILEATLSSLGREFYYDDATAQELRNVLTSAIALQVEAGFSREFERIIILDRDVTPLDFVYSVYGSIDRLAEWITQNELTGDENFVIRAGREIRYYE